MTSLNVPCIFGHPHQVIAQWPDCGCDVIDMPRVIVNVCSFLAHSDLFFFLFSDTCS